MTAWWYHDGNIVYYMLYTSHYDWWYYNGVVTNKRRDLITKGSWMVDINIDWMWMGVGFVIGISSAWFVSDLVFPVKNKDRDNE